MAEVSDVAVQVISPGVTRVRFFGPPVAADASYVVAGPLHPTMGPLHPHGPPAPAPASGSGEAGRPETDGGNVVLSGGGSDGQPVSLVFYDPAGKRLLGTP